MKTERRRYLSPSEKATVLNRQRGICACGCAEPLEMGAIEYDHILPLWAGGSNKLDNFHALKPKHHGAKTSRETKQRAKCDRIAAREGLRKKRLSKVEREIQRKLMAGPRSAGGPSHASIAATNPGEPGPAGPAAPKSEGAT